MSYVYATQRAAVVTADNIPKIMAAKDAIAKVVETSGAITFDKAMSLTDFDDTWAMMACLDYLVELGYFFKVQGQNGSGQDQILVPRRR